jgi:hypothetical protein
MAKQQKVKIPLGERFDSIEIDNIGKDIIEYIKRRTEDGIGIKETSRGLMRYSFPKYSEAYIKSLDFKIAGKNPKSVDLTLSGDMLAALEVLDATSSSITIGYEAGSEENARAEGNQLGSYGGDPKPKKARKFLGLTKGEVEEILRGYR